MATKTTSMRLSEEMAAELAAVARVDGQSVSAATREAVEKHITERTEDPEFQRRVKERLEEDMRIAKRLAARLTDASGDS